MEEKLVLLKTSGQVRKWTGKKEMLVKITKYIALAKMTEHKGSIPPFTI